MKKIGEIKDEFTAAKEADWQSMCNQYREDSRSGVQKLILQYEKKIKALEAEKLRMEQMMQYEHKYEHLGYLCGIDEVGRGSSMRSDSSGGSSDFVSERFKEIDST